jgi:hypothetical protein
MKLAASKDGTGIYFLSATITSPTLARQWQAAQKAWPKAKLVQYDPALAGTAASKGVNVQYALSGADVIVSLDADFLVGRQLPRISQAGPRVRKAAQGPGPSEPAVCVESSPTTTGLKAEHRLGLRASEIPAFAAELAKAVGVGACNSPAMRGPMTSRRSSWPLWPRI